MFNYEAIMKNTGYDGHIFFPGCRNPSKCESDLEALRSSFSGTFVCLKLDLTDLDSVSSFAEEVNGRCQEVHALVNNGKSSGLMPNF